MIQLKRMPRSRQRSGWASLRSNEHLAALRWSAERNRSAGRPLTEWPVSRRVCRRAVANDSVAQAFVLQPSARNSFLVHNFLSRLTRRCSGAAPAFPPVRSKR